MTASSGGHVLYKPFKGTKYPYEYDPDEDAPGKSFICITEPKPACKEPQDFPKNKTNKHHKKSPRDSCVGMVLVLGMAIVELYIPSAGKKPS